jgi:hypothetical protein
MQEDIRYQAAKQQVTHLREFYSHLIAYISVNSFLAAVNIFLISGFPWVLLVIGFWGIGIALHAWETFGYRDDWEERKIAELMGEKPKNAANQDYFEESAVE